MRPSWGQRWATEPTERWVGPGRTGGGGIKVEHRMDGSPGENEEGGQVWTGKGAGGLGAPWSGG